MHFGGQGKGEGGVTGWEVQHHHLPPLETPLAATVHMAKDAHRHPARTQAVGVGRKAGPVPLCRCRVIYDMREGHCLDPSCIFPRALPLFPDPRCAPATVPLLWEVLPAPRLCGAVPGRAARRGRTHLEPRAPLPAAQPLGGPADVPRAWEWGFRPLQVHGHRRHSAAGGEGSGIWGVWLHSPFPFSAGSVLGAYRSPVPFSS